MRTPRLLRCLAAFVLPATLVAEQAPPAVSPQPARSLTGPWVPWVDAGYSGTDSGIVIHDGERISLRAAWKEDGLWVTVACDGSLKGGSATLTCAEAPGSMSSISSRGTMTLTLSADGNHLDGAFVDANGQRHASHWTRRPWDSGPDSGSAPGKGLPPPGAPAEPNAIAPIAAPPDAAPEEAADSPSWTRPGPSYEASEGIIRLGVRIERPGTILDTVGLDAASIGSFSLIAQPDGRLTWNVYAPDVPSAGRDASGWHRLSSDPVAGDTWHRLEIWYGTSGTQLVVDGRAYLLLDLRVPLSGERVFLGDYPNDARWEPRLDSRRGFVGSLRGLSFGPIVRR